MQNNDLSDNSAHAEAKRLLLVIATQRRVQNRMFGTDQPASIEFDENSAWCAGMTSLFRFARGEDIPPFVVQDFLDDLLKLMFCGLATNSMALPPFCRMHDRPWAIAWRLAELRLGIQGDQEMDAPQLAHLLGEPAESLRKRLSERGYSPDGPVPREFLDELYRAIRLSRPE